MQEVLDKIEARLHRAPHDIKNRWDLSFYRNSHGNWTAQAKHTWTGKKIYGFGGVNPYPPTMLGAMQNLLSRLEEE